jgi:membrane dipeptidase
LGAGAAIAGVPFYNLGAYPVGPGGKRYSKRVVELVASSLVIDVLAPIKIDFSPEFYAPRLSDKLAAEFRTSGITGFHHAVGLGGPNARESALAFFATWGNFVARNSHVFAAAGTAADLVRAKADGKAAIIMGLQNADHFNRPEDVKFFYDIGQRCSQLTYNSQNRIGSGSTERVDGGVTDFGVAIIDAMNNVGMLVDVSLSGVRTTLDAIALSKKPIAITHSNCRALVPGHPRVKTDEAIKALGANGGVMGITGVRNFVSAKEPTTITNYVDHIDHVAKLIGIEHVGIGSDSDLNGYDDTSPELNKMLRGAYKDSYAFREKIDTDGFDHPLKTYDLVEELIRRRYSDANIAAVLGGNFHRLLAATWGG